jgi:hypothetical protein
MQEVLRKTVALFSENPRKLFGIDAIGAALTAAMMFFVLPQINAYIGMPLEVYSPLGIIGLIYGLFSIFCYFFVTARWSFYLRTISIANALYIACTVILLIMNIATVTPFGWIYFLGEIGIIATLVWLEWKVSSKVVG